MPDKSRPVWYVLQPLVIVLLLVGVFVLFFGVPGLLIPAFEEDPTIAGIIAVAVALSLPVVFLIFRRWIRR